MPAKRRVHLTVGPVNMTLLGERVSTPLLPSPQLTSTPPSWPSAWGPATSQGSGDRMVPFLPPQDKGKDPLPAGQVDTRKAGREVGGSGVQVQSPRPQEHRGQGAGLPLRKVTWGVPQTHKWPGFPRWRVFGGQGPCSPSHSPEHPGPTPETQEQLGKCQAMGGRMWGLEPQDHQPAWASPELGEQQRRRWHFYWGQAGLPKVCKRRLKNLVTP